MTDISLTPITSGYNLAKVNDNFDKIEEMLNNDVLNLDGGNNVMLQDLDMNSNALLNLGVDVDNPGSVLTVEVADQRYYNVDGDMLTGPMNVNGQTVTGLKVATGPTEAVRKSELDGEASARAAGDANLQAQLTGEVPLEASAFSEISWHGQTIGNSVTIPTNKNAWSFGPTMTIASGQVVTVSPGSFWTIANGATTGEGTLTTELPSPIDFGEL
jgi:hypothetical protein